MPRHNFLLVAQKVLGEEEQNGDDPRDVRKNQFL